MGGGAVGTALSPALHCVGPTQAGLGLLSMPSVLPMPPPSSSPPLPQSTVGTVTEGLVGLQLGGRKERKANQRRDDDPVFPHLAPLAPGTTGCPDIPVSPPWDPCLPSPAAWPHLDLLILTPEVPSWPYLDPRASEASELATCRDPKTPLLLPTIYQHPSPVGPGLSLQGNNPLHPCLNLTLACWLLWGGILPFLREPLITQKRGTALMDHQGRFKPSFPHSGVLAWVKGGDLAPKFTLLGEKEGLCLPSHPCTSLRIPQ